MVLVSIIIPIYNSEKYLKQCLDSVLNQTLKNIEILCINNGSSDNSVRIVKSYQEKDSRFKLFTAKEKQNTGYARNIGLENSSGEYIMLLDSDDWFEPTACEEAYNQIKKNNNEILFFNYRRFYEYKNEYKISGYMNSVRDYIEEPNIRLYDIDTNFIGSYHCMAIYKKDFLKKFDIKYSNTLHNQDVPFRIKAILYADTISILDKVLYNYRIQNNKPKKRDFEHIDQYFYNVKKAYTELINCPRKEQFIKRFMIKYIQQVLNRYEHFDTYNPNIAIKKKLFMQIHKILRLFSESYNVDNIENAINADKYKLFYNYSNFYAYYLYGILNNIFSVRNKKNHKIITIFGIKLKFKGSR